MKWSEKQVHIEEIIAVHGRDLTRLATELYQTRRLLFPSLFVNVATIIWLVKELIENHA